MSIGGNLKRLREEKMLTQRELGDMVYVTQSMIAQIERDFAVLSLFLSKCGIDSTISTKASGKLDYVASSNIDERIQDVMFLFVNYSNAKDIYRANMTEHNKKDILVYLKKITQKLEDIFSEFWSNTDCLEEREYIKAIFDKIT